MTPRAIWSGGRRCSSAVDTDDDELSPDRRDLEIDRPGRSAGTSPARSLRVLSVRGSATPPRTTVLENNERKPSASAPHRARACERSWRQPSVRSPWPPPSLTTLARSGRGAMFASSSRAKSTGRFWLERRYAASWISLRRPTTKGASWDWLRPGAAMNSVWEPSTKLAASSWTPAVESSAPRER